MAVVQHTTSTQQTRSELNQDQFSLGRVLLLIFLPTSLLTLVYYLAGLLLQNTIPSILLFFILALLILFPIQIGIVGLASKKITGRFSLQSAFLRHKPLSWWKVLIIAALLWGFAGLMTVTVAPWETLLFAPLAERLAPLVPAYFDWTNIAYLEKFPPGLLFLTGLTYLLLNGFIGPISEELFFRGYLTPKISRYGNFAPFIITVLFSLYHFWLPFSNLFRIAAFFPAYYIAWRMKNIYIAIVFHILSNLVSAVGFIAALAAL
jgi:uncharacterized protein